METIRIFEHGSMDTRRMAHPVPHPGPRLLRKGLRVGPQIWLSVQIELNVELGRLSTFPEPSSTLDWHDFLTAGVI